MIKIDEVDIPRIEYIDPVDGKVSILRVMQDGVQIWPTVSDAINTPTGIQLSEYEIEEPYTYLLDDYPGASAAYSLKKLGESQTQAIRVRRSSDNAATDVYFYDDPNKSIDLLSDIEAGGTLGDWAGSDTVYVRKWYDQSGSNQDALQTVNTYQPILISNGVLNTVNGLSSISFDGSNIFDVPSFGIAGSGARSILSVVKPDVNSIPSGYYFNSGDGTGSSYSPVRHWNLSSEYGIRVQGGNKLWSAIDLNQRLATFIYDLSTAEFYKDSTIQVSTGGSTPSAINTYETQCRLGGAITGAEAGFQGNLQELIVYPSDQTANRLSIETIINNHYSIYLYTAEVDAQLIQADNDNVSDTVIEINGVRSSASDTAVANLISRNVTVITA